MEAWSTAVVAATAPVCNKDSLALFGNYCGEMERLLMMVYPVLTTLVLMTLGQGTRHQLKPHSTSSRVTHNLYSRRAPHTAGTKVGEWLGARAGAADDAAGVHKPKYDTSSSEIKPRGAYSTLIQSIKQNPLRARYILFNSTNWHRNPGPQVYLRCSFRHGSACDAECSVCRGP